MSHEAPRFLALEPVSFSTTAAYSFVFAVWRCNQTCLSMWDLSAGALYLRPRIAIEVIHRQTIVLYFFVEFHTY